MQVLFSSNPIPTRSRPPRRRAGSFPVPTVVKDQWVDPASPHSTRRSHSLQNMRPLRTKLRKLPFPSPKQQGMTLSPEERALLQELGNKPAGTVLMSLGKEGIALRPSPTKPTTCQFVSFREVGRTFVDSVFTNSSHVINTRTGAIEPPPSPALREQLFDLLRSVFRPRKLTFPYDRLNCITGKWTRVTH